MPSFLPYTARDNARVMMFVDGENLAIRYKDLLGETNPVSHVKYLKDVMVWSEFASRINGPQNYIRRFYYTSTPGDETAIESVSADLKKLGIEAPRVFHKKKGGRSKRVDIMLTTEMLTHAHRKNYDIAILVTGDADYVPLVEAVQAEGCQVALWALSSGLSPALKNVADHYWNIGELFFENETPATREKYA